MLFALWLKFKFQSNQIKQKKKKKNSRKIVYLWQKTFWWLQREWMNFYFKWFNFCFFTISSSFSQFFNSSESTKSKFTSRSGNPSKRRRHLINSIIIIISWVEEQLERDLKLTHRAGIHVSLTFRQCRWSSHRTSSHFVCCCETWLSALER